MQRQQCILQAAFVGLAAGVSDLKTHRAGYRRCVTSCSRPSGQHLQLRCGQRVVWAARESIIAHSRPRRPYWRPTAPGSARAATRSHSRRGAGPRIGAQPTRPAPRATRARRHVPGQRARKEEVGDRDDHRRSPKRPPKLVRRPAAELPQQPQNHPGVGHDLADRSTTGCAVSRWIHPAGRRCEHRGGSGWCRVPPTACRREARRVGDRMCTIGEPAPHHSPSFFTPGGATPPETRGDGQLVAH